MRKKIILLLCCIFPILITSCFKSKMDVPLFSVTRMDGLSGWAESGISYVGLWGNEVPYDGSENTWSNLKDARGASYRIDGILVKAVGAHDYTYPTVTLSPGKHTASIHIDGYTETYAISRIKYRTESHATHDCEISFETKAGTDYFLDFHAAVRGISGRGPLKGIEYVDPVLKIREAPSFRSYINSGSIWREVPEKPGEIISWHYSEPKFPIIKVEEPEPEIEEITWDEYRKQQRE